MNNTGFAMEDPEDLVAIDSIKRLTNLNPDILVVGPTLLEKALEKVYGEIQKSAEVDEAISGITVVSGEEGSEELVDLSPDKASAEDAPIVKLVNLILQEAIKERATDIHLEPQEGQVTVRIRIDGVLQTIMTPPVSSLSGLSTRIKILSKLNIAEKRLPQDGDFPLRLPVKILMYVFPFYLPYRGKKGLSCAYWIRRALISVFLHWVSK
ncbi:MAG: hypothetical protein Ct9H300mP9_8350 [Candidatus Neomarinimicrobiota bacterium]|nr:MAG: hypothetical protein Ct9H300mP9_8350 [Candidatus Neomarinimicrobiota bacterium]